MCNTTHSLTHYLFPPPTVPLSAASSLVLDKAIHGLLSESVDGLATAPRRSKRTKIATSPFVSWEGGREGGREGEKGGGKQREGDLISSSPYLGSLL